VKRRAPRRYTSSAVALVIAISATRIAFVFWPRIASISAYAAYVPGNFML